jgi:hypothetical protein
MPSSGSKSMLTSRSDDGDIRLMLRGSRADAQAPAIARTGGCS